MKLGEKSRTRKHKNLHGASQISAQWVLEKV